MSGTLVEDCWFQGLELEDEAQAIALLPSDKTHGSTTILSGVPQSASFLAARRLTYWAVKDL